MPSYNAARVGNERKQYLLCSASSKCCNKQFYFHTLYSSIVSSSFLFYWKFSGGLPLLSFSTHEVMSDELLSFFPVIYIVKENKRVTIPRPKVDLPETRMCVIISKLYLRIPFYSIDWKLYPAKGFIPKEIRENEKLKHSVDGSFLTANKWEGCAIPGEVGVDLMPETVRAGIESTAVNLIITKLDYSISG